MLALEEINTQEGEKVGSLNHSYIQANLAWTTKKFLVYTKLSLDISNSDLEGIEKLKGT